MLGAMRVVVIRAAVILVAAGSGVVFNHGAHGGLKAADGGGREQQACAAPAIETSDDPNIFTEEQERFLGDVITDQIIKDFRVFQDASLTSPLQAIGDRLLATLPGNRFKLQFYLIDLPEANAFVLPGGRIFVSRKMVSFAVGEEELAGVLAHELGHLVTRQQSIAISRQFKKVLNVTSMGDRQDVVEKYHKLLDNAARNPGAFRSSAGHEGRDQVAADRMGIFLLSSAGYDPASFAKFWDRFAETKGKTGGFFSDLFGMTSPDARRLKEAVRATSAVPPACIASKPATSPDFHQWQNSVRGFVPRPVPESLRNVVSRARLNPPLRTEVIHLRFSPDGKHVLAQDDSGITVLTRTPFAPIFRIPATEAEPASFTPDSSRVVFHTSDLRVEVWRVADRTLDQAHELVLHVGCVQTSLSNDGRTLACFDGDFGINLFDVATSAPIYQKKTFFDPDLGTLMRILAYRGDLGAASLVNMGFSPDGRFFAAGHRNTFSGGDSVLLYDLQAKAALTPKGNVKKYIANNFVFTGPDRLLAVNPEDAAKSSVVSLPSAEATGTVFLMSTDLTAATKGDYVFVRPMLKYAVGVLELAKGVGTKGLTSSAIDVYDDVFVAERGTGELGLYSFATNQVTAQATLLAATLGRLRAAAASSDLRYLAVSERSRGGVWDVPAGRRVLQIRGFRGAGFDDRSAVVVDLPRQREERRRIAQIDAATGQGMTTADVKDEQATQYGALVVVRSPVERGRDPRLGVTIEVKDARTLAPLWKKTFEKETPIIDMDAATERLVVAWQASSAIARAEVRRDPELRKRLDALEEPEGDLILQVLDGRTGQLTGTVFVETGKGSFAVVDVISSGDWVAIEDSENRTRLYSLSTGELKGRIIGGTPIVHGGRSIVAIQNGTRVAVHDTGSLSVRDEFTFSHPIAFAAFSRDGNRLLVLTTDHSVTVLDVSRPSLVELRRGKRALSGVAFALLESIDAQRGVQTFRIDPSVHPPAVVQNQFR